MTLFNNEWDQILDDELTKSYFIKLQAFLDEEYRQYEVFPARENLYNALKYTSYEKVKVIIIGQDPYINPNQAHGLAFSVMKEAKIPPSLRNIFKEIAADVNVKNDSGCLVNWATQGVLLLNVVLSVRAHQIGSHQGYGWEHFTDRIIKELNNHPHALIFMLWGVDAKKKMSLITNPAHYILTAAHPSPQAAYRGFFGCRHFSKANEILTNLKQKPINWSTNNEVD